MDPTPLTLPDAAMRALRELQPIPPLVTEPTDFRRPLVLGSQPPPAASGIRDRERQLTDDAKDVATSGVHLQLRQTYAGITLPTPGTNFKVWPEFLTGIGRTVMQNENDLFVGVGNRPFTGDVSIPDKNLMNVNLKPMYTDDELRAIFGEPQVFAEGTSAWYANITTGVNPDQDLFFVYDQQMQGWIPRYYNGNRVFPVEWDAERLLNKPPPARAPPKGMPEKVDKYENIRAVVPPFPDAPKSYGTAYVRSRA